MEPVLLRMTTTPIACMRQRSGVRIYIDGFIRRLQPSTVSLLHFKNVFWKRGFEYQTNPINIDARNATAIESQLEHKKAKGHIRKKSIPVIITYLTLPFNWANSLPIICSTNCCLWNLCFQNDTTSVQMANLSPNIHIFVRYYRDMFLCDKRSESIVHVAKSRNLKQQEKILN